MYYIGITVSKISSLASYWLLGQAKLKSALISLFSLSVCLSLVSCANSISTAENEPLANDYITTISNKIVIKNNLKEKVKFQKGNDSRAFSLRPQDNGIKLEGAKGQPLSTLTVDAKGKITIATSAGSILGHVSGNSNYWQLKDGEETKVLYFLRKQADGNYQLESTQDRPIYSINSRNDGFEIKTTKGESIYQVKVEDDRTILLDRDNNIILKTQSSLSPIAVACYGFSVLNRHQQTALAYAVSLMEK